MDERDALQYIFPNEFDFKSGLLYFNGKEYDYNRYREVDTHSPDFYCHVLNLIEKSDVKADDVKTQIDANIVDVVKITEEQFYSWYNGKCRRTQEKKLTGKEIWLTLKKEAVED